MMTAAVVSAVAFLFLYLRLHWGLVIAVLLAVGIYFGLFFFLKPNRKIAGIDAESVPGGEALLQMLDEGEADLRSLAASARAVSDPAVRREAEALCDTGRRILDYLNENPEKIKSARRFFTYYLDISSKLLNRYVEFQETGLRSEEVRDILKQTAEAIPVLTRAFENQFTHLMQGELMDVEADIELLKSTLKMEGGE